jgi:small GTP-binding protein
MSYDYLFKLIIVGDSGVGKSSLLKRFIDGLFNSNYDLTIGVEFGAKIIDIQDKKIKLQLWDTAGQESFRSLTKSYYRGSAGIILVYDITKRQSFTNLESWIKDIESVNKTNVPIMVIGNKVDLYAIRQVEKEDLNDFACKNRYLFKEISVKNDNDAGQIFSDFSSHILTKILNREIEVTEKNGIKTNNNATYNPPIYLDIPYNRITNNCCRIN